MFRIGFHAPHDLRRYAVPRCWALHTQTHLCDVLAMKNAPATTPCSRRFPSLRVQVSRPTQEMLVGAAVGVVGSCQLPQLAASSLLRATAPAALLALRGGASVGPIKCGPISIDLLLGPRGCAASPARSGTTSPGPSPDPRPCQGAVHASAAAGPAHTLSHSPSLAPQPPPLSLRPLLLPRARAPTSAARAPAARQVRRAQRGGGLTLQHEPDRSRSEYA